MGKKNKKTRWRTLTLNGHQSDSEESSTKSSSQTSKSYQHKYSKFPYSSQSTPIRKFQHESSKSTRSNSTTSEHKATFNEDEYTRITTPRQDVLFKKGYLNKPKNYQTQTSTGTSSTANSTSTCTPDHQSADGTEGTDLDYESQFVFPNGFIDHNGIYYINSFEPFPLVVYNAPICYPEYPRSKRYSTDSMTESVSPHNEETNQEVPQNGIGEHTINNTPVFTQNYIQPSGYYYSNGISNLTNGEYIIEETKRIKKKRRRRISRTKSSNNEDLTSEESDDYDSSDEVFSQSEFKKHSKSNHVTSISHQPNEISTKCEEVTQSTSPNTNEFNAKQNGHDENLEASGKNYIKSENSGELSPNESMVENHAIVQSDTEQNHIETTNEEQQGQMKLTNEEQDQIKSNGSEAQNLLLQSLLKSSEKNSESDHSITDKPNSISDPPKDCINDELQESSLKPDAEEFIPRTLRQPEPLPFDSNVQFLNLPPNFIPIPFLNHIGEIQTHPQFLPPGIPVNFIPPQDPKMLPNFVNVVPNGNFVPKTSFDGCTVEVSDTKPCQKEEKDNEKCEDSKTQNEPEVTPVKKPPKTEIDIAKIVSKLEEAAKQQRYSDTKRPNYSNRNSHKYNTSKLYQKGRFLNHSYHQRNRPNNLEQTYERKYRRTEPRSKPEVQNEEQSRIDTAKIEMTEKIKEECQPPPNVDTEEHICSIVERSEHGEKQETQDLVNNVNTRLNNNCSIINKDLRLENNYSETLKKRVDITQQNNTKSTKSTTCPRYEKHNSEKNERKSEEKIIIMQTLSQNTKKPQNQWISVSNRKKRKCKNNEEPNSFDDQEEISNDDHLFESFDVNLLVDVMPPNIEESNQESIKESVIQEKCDTEIVEVPKYELPVVIEFKEEIITETTLQTKEKLPSKSKTKNDKKKKTKKKGQVKRVIITDINIESDKPISINQNEDTIKPNDVPIQSTPEVSNNSQTDNAINLQPVLVEVLENKVDLPSTTESTANVCIEESIPIKEVISETPERKNKKKKKKSSPKQSALGTTKIQSISSSTTTLNNLDESYDFLLEDSILEDLDQKTNVEISQELDKVIQKGLYSNLEEKIRALKISALDDGFFKTINSSSHIPEKSSNIINASNFGNILKNTTHLLKIPKNKEEINPENLINIDFSKIKLPDLEPQPSTSKEGIFLENPEVAKIMEDSEKTDEDNTNSFLESKTNNKAKLKNKIKQPQDSKEGEEKEEEQIIIEKGEKQNAMIEQDTKNLTTTSNTFSSQLRQDTLYPITQAVKEWMNKTREKTPDVEILKSPNTIYKEFCEGETETESESSGDSKTECETVKSTSKEPSPLTIKPKENTSLPTKVKSIFNNDDEITVWSLSPQNSIEEDLMDCWENEEELNPNIKNGIIIQNGGIKEIKGSVQNGHTHINGHIEEGEEAIEVYESKYGNNDDFLKLKAEIEEHRKKNINFSRHGDLPYRAICCSIM